MGLIFIDSIQTPRICFHDEQDSKIWSEPQEINYLTHHTLHEFFGLDDNYTEKTRVSLS